MTEFSRTDLVTSLHDLERKSLAFHASRPTRRPELRNAIARALPVLQPSYGLHPELDAIRAALLGHCQSIERLLDREEHAPHALVLRGAVNESVRFLALLARIMREPIERSIGSATGTS